MKIEVSIGELFDKLSILSIKMEKIQNKEKWKDVKKEYDLLIEKAKTLDGHLKHIADLEKINLRIWEIEDDIRKKESKKEFDEEFIALARGVYFNNDKRFEIKNHINQKFMSEVKEQKEYEKYK